MMTNGEILQILFGMFLWMITMELFFSKYFYTQSEQKKISQNFGAVITRLLGTITGIALVLFTVVKYYF